MLKNINHYINKNMSKAVVLFSGGLDSVIVIKLLQEQNIDVTALYIENGFHKGNKDKYLKDLASKLNVKLVIKDSRSEFFDMWKEPKYGYGKAMNPCVNCHALMTNIALNFMDEINADFVASGEVLEQRGFSQTTHQMKKVIKLIERPEKILRPLSAKSMKATQMEKDNLVDRELLLNIKGKSRKIQYELLSKYGLKKDEVEVPAGGCILAEPGIKKKVEGLDIEKLKLEDFEVFKYGRQCLVDGVKFVLSRDRYEMKQLNKYNVDKGSFVKVTTNEIKSPMGLLDLTSEELNDFITNFKKDERIIKLLDNVKEKIKGFVKFENLDTYFKIKIESNFNVIEW